MQPVTYGFSRSNRLFDLLSLVFFALFLFPLLMTVGTGLLLLEVPGTDWIKSYGAADDIANFWLYLAMAVFLGSAFALTLVIKAPARNLLALDDVGLTYVFMGLRRTWPWRDLDSAEVAFRWPGLQVGKLTIAGRFGWGTRIGFLFMNGVASAGRLAFTLPDFYEPPIEDVIAGINDYRDRALGIKRPAEDEAQPSPSMQAAAAGQSITFSMPKIGSHKTRIIAFAPVIILGLMLIFNVELLFPAEGETWSDPWSIGGASGLLFLLAVVLIPFLFFVAYRTSKPENNSLRLDAAGLTYIRQGQRYAWPWKDVSAFEHHKLAGANLAGRRRVITFAAPGRDWTWRWLRLLYGLPKAPPAVVIDGLYDTPAAEIAATLNAYRDYALGADGGPQAPESAWVEDAMQTTNYRVCRLTISDVTMIGLGSFMCLLGLSHLAWDSWRAGGLAQAWTQDTLDMSMSVAQVLIGFGLALVSWVKSMKKTGTGYLKLDERGLTHAEGRVRRQWRWDELSTFKPERYWGRRNVVFTVPGPAGATTLYEASKRNLPDGPLVRIQDIYDTPVDEIAATLNAYRERALGGGGAKAGTPAPEQA